MNESNLPPGQPDPADVMEMKECPYCDGDNTFCTTCDGTGEITEHEYELYKSED